IMSAKNLKHAARMLQRRIGCGPVAVRRRFVAPFLGVVPALLRIEAREQAGEIVFFGVPEILGNQGGGIGVMDQVVVEEALALVALFGFLSKDRLVTLEHVVDERAKEDDVATRP